MNLTEQFGIDAAERSARRSFLDLTEEDARLLTELLPVVEREVDAIVDRFYDRLLAFPEARTYLEDPDALGRAKRAQRAYLLDLFRGDFGEAYFERRLQIGVVHDRIGLPPKWYLGGNSIFYENFLPLIQKRYLLRPFKMAQCLVALYKVLNLDQQLVMDTYIGTMVRRLVDLGRELGDAIRVLAPSAQQSADQAQAALKLAETGVASATSGNHAAAELLSSLSLQKAKAQETALKIRQFADQVTRIERVASQVTDISLETDLLALNASVQATHLTEEQAGFGVVATEVRKLADQTRLLIEEVRDLLLEIKTGSDATISLGEETARAVDAGKSLAESTGTAFSDLETLVRSIHDSARVISDASGQQADAILRLQELAAEIR